MTIQRYTPVKRHVDFNPTQDGSWMLYSDHLAAIAAYEARLAEDAKVRAQLVEALEAAREWMIEEGCDCGVDEPESCALCLTVAALAAAKGIE